MFCDGGCTLTTVPHWDMKGESRRNSVTTESPPDDVL